MGKCPERTESGRKRLESAQNQIDNVPGLHNLGADPAVITVRACINVPPGMPTRRMPNVARRGPRRGWGRPGAVITVRTCVRAAHLRNRAIRGPRSGWGPPGAITTAKHGVHVGGVVKPNAAVCVLLPGYLVRRQVNKK